MDFYQAWRSGKVVRMHTMPQLVQENVAAHTWGILLALVKYYPDAPAHLYRAIVLHDAGEVATGDIPAHVKWALPELESILNKKEEDWLSRAGLANPLLTKEEGALLIVFDKLDFCMSCVHELRLGNLNSARYLHRSFNKAKEVFSQMDDRLTTWDAANNYISEFIQICRDYLKHIPEEEYDREC